jgi:class 3 adenylate cyclase
VDRPPPVQYAVTDDGVHIAYQVLGDGPIDILFVGSWFGHMDVRWEWPGYRQLLEGLAAFGRVIVFDKRGVGASDPAPSGSLTLEAWLDDARAVLDAVGVEAAAVVAATDATTMAILFGATFAHRTRALVLLQARAVMPSVSNLQMIETWGTDRAADALAQIAPSVADDPAYRQWFGRLQRLAAGPGAAAAMYDMLRAIDVRPVLAGIHVPTLVLTRTDLVSPLMTLEASKEVAEGIPGAKLVLIPGVDVHVWVGDVAGIVTEVQDFLTGTRPVHEPDRALLTVLFTDIVGSTERAAALGDRAWSELLGRHEVAARRCIAEHRGHEIFTKGDEFLVTFDGPARAVRCGQALVRAAATLDLQVRVGLHTGEVERRGDDIGGIAVHIGARVMATAGGGEVLVSRTVRDLVAGSGLAFEDAGSHVLKGVPDEWQLYRVMP